jgi:hypothetical protein
MKKIFQIILTAVVTALLLLASIFTFAANPSQDSSSIAGFLDWLGRHWELVVLILSEVAALLPTKWSGIIDLIIKILQAVFSKKNGSSNY